MEAGGYPDHSASKSSDLTASSPGGILILQIFTVHDHSKARLRSIRRIELAKKKMASPPKNVHPFGVSSNSAAKKSKYSQSRYNHLAGAHQVEPNFKLVDILARDRGLFTIFGPIRAPQYQKQGLANAGLKRVADHDLKLKPEPEKPKPEQPKPAQPKPIPSIPSFGFSGPQVLGLGSQVLGR